MNWAYRFMRATPDVELWAAAPWMLRNEYFGSDIRFFLRPFQQMTGWQPKDEWQYEWVYKSVIRGERVWPLYRNWLERQLRRERPDVMHAHFAPAACYYSALAQKLDIPLVASFYGYDFESLSFRKPAYLEKYRELFGIASAVTTTGELTAKIPLEQGCPLEKIKPVHLGIHPDEFPFSPRNKEPNRLQMVQIATITGKKGYMDTLQSLKMALGDCPDIHLTIAGEQQDSDLARRMRAFIQMHDLERHVTWLDFLPHSSLPGFLSRFDVFIHPSHYSASRDCEGAPVSIVEAQATGLPVISTVHSDIPRQVLHNITGLLAAERDTATLADHIRRFYFMENTEYQQFSQNARRHIEQNFDVKNSAQKLRSLYETLTSHPSPPMS
jgi:colanic acid/amylovoran biosynthesis glycosyltransferase